MLMKKYSIVFRSKIQGGKNETLTTRTEKKSINEKCDFLSLRCWRSRRRCFKSMSDNNDTGRHNLS